MVMAAILFNGAEPFEQIIKIPFDKRPHAKSGENCSSGLGEEI